MTKFLYALGFVLICTIILLKCNNPIKTWIKGEITQREIVHEVKTVESLRYQYIHDTVTIIKKDSYGRTHATAKSLAGTKLQLSFIKHKLDSLSRQFGLHYGSKVDNLLSANIGFKGHETSADFAGDDGYNYHFDKGFLKADVFVDSDLKNATLDYSGEIGLNGVLYWKRKHHFLFIRFGKPEYSQQLYCDDSNLKVKSISSIKILKK